MAFLFFSIVCLSSLIRSRATSPIKPRESSRTDNLRSTQYSNGHDDDDDDKNRDKRW